MRKKLQFRWAIVGIATLVALWYLWPTIRLYSMSPAERAEVQAGEAGAWEELKEGAIKLGLDLQGGMHLVLELDESKRAFTGEERADAIDRALEIIRNRVDQFGVSEPLIQKVGDERIIVELPGIQDEERAKDLVQRTAFLEFQIVADPDRATEEIRAFDGALAGRTFAPDTSGAGALADSAAGVGAASDSTRAAASEQDTAGAQSLGEFLGQEEAARPAGSASDGSTEAPRPFSTLLQVDPTQQADYVVAEEDVPRVRAMLADSVVSVSLGEGLEWLWGATETYADGRSYRALWLVEEEPELTGEAIATAAAGFDPQVGNQPIVSLEMTGDGAARFAEVTGQHVNERLAIVLDEIVRMAPNIRQRIAGGRAQIEGFDSVEEARDIGIVLRAGALPAPLEIIEERTVGPSLGADSIASGWRAGVLGLFAVAVLIILYYRASGAVAVVALALNIVLILACLAGFGATLTLPGIAGLILTVGMAVDANVLVFERVREEVALGKSVRAALDAGYNRAFVTIFDSQITTLIAALVLFQFGTGPIKGFAVVLTIGILTSIFTAVFVTRTLFDTWTRRTDAQRLSI
ncbi:hypothetical protein BH18GEM1_BH18GEM1_01910 [soil metagenome]